MPENFDTIMSRLGTGKWNYMYFFSLGYWYFFTPPLVLAPSFMAPKVPFSCRTPTEDPMQQDFMSNSSPSECTYLETSVDGYQQEQMCKEWDFDNSTFTNTIFSQYALVCDRQYLHAVYTSIFMIGSLLGAPLNALSDKYGRKSVLAIATCMYTFFSIVTPFLPNITAVIIVRFILGILYMIPGNTGYNLVVEVCDPAQRSIVGVTIWLSWVLGVVGWGILGYAVRDWRTQHTIAAAPLFFFLTMLWFMDESPRWLAVVGRHKECKRVLRKAARWNNVQLPHEKDIDIILDNTVRDKSDPVYKSISSLYQSQSVAYRTGWRAVWDGFMDGVNTFLSLFSTAKLRLRTSITWLNFFLVGMVFWGLSMSGVSFSSDPFLYMVLKATYIYVRAIGAILDLVLTKLLHNAQSLAAFILVHTCFSGDAAYVPGEANWSVIWLV
ncbi:unnamed protein product, partial [Meganyctiphanes norvegica]